MYHPRISFALAALLLIGNSGVVRGTDAPPKSLTVALITSQSSFGDVQANLNHFDKLIGEAAAAGARLVCFPELALVGYSTHADVLKAAQPVPGPATVRLAEIARRHRVYISAGMAERDEQRHHIAQIVVGPDGYLGKYRKCFPTGMERACGFLPGQGYPTWDIDGFRFGIVICADGRQETTIQEMKKRGVDVIHHPHGNYVGNLGRDAEEWTRSKLVYIAPRALTSRAHILINNSAGDIVEPTGTRQFGSGAMVIDSLGQVVRRTDQRDRAPRMILATLAHPLSLIPPGELQKLSANDPDLGERMQRDAASRTADRREIKSPPEPPPTSAIAIIGARLIDGRGDDPIEDAVVIVRGSKIVAAGPRSNVAIPPEAKRLDATGLSVLPGLIDSHFHSKNDVIRPVTYQLQHGITTFRDPGHPFRFYDAVRATESTMPRIFLCGAHLDAHPPAYPDQAVVVTDAEHAVRTVNAHVDAGASAIKIYMRLPLEHIAATCDAARKRGVLATAHLELVDADAAIRAGVRGIEHVTSFGTALAEPEATARFKAAVGSDSAARHQLRHWLWSTIDLDTSPRVKPVLNLVVQERVFISPTLAVFEKRKGDKGASESDIGGFANMLKFVGLCHRAGARVVVGSHTSAPHAAVGRAYQREIEMLVEAGLSPLEAITAGTLHNAQFFGADGRLGTIEPSKLADLILVEGDPSRDIDALKNVRHVMLNGLWQPDPS